ncbi:hypothetical protein N7495_003418 [Penicillium taxi]|uniref:uncharacterized protein n=1 Tax=Penicillium taxi TaxID=168475 RepID=UPI002544F0AD|nr:uncharacterized protein N7495_003418 [Penicillium taxi]KAJ5902890.1 hypothetical protein N7495_003418 [Penicillium taxi]
MVGLKNSRWKLTTFEQELSSIADSSLVDTLSLPALSLKKRRVSRIETPLAETSTLYQKYLAKGHGKYNIALQTVQKPPSTDPGPSTINSNRWTMVEITAELDDPLMSEDEEIPCDDEELELYSDFELSHLGIKWNQNTFKDILVYLKSNSKLRYRNYYGPKIGVIVAKSNYGQVGKARAPDKWSDIAWLVWVQQCSLQNTLPSQLGYIIQEAIANDDTTTLLDEITRGMAKEEKDKPVVFTWTPQDEEFYALLGSPNGIGTAFLSINYPNALGLKVPSYITAFSEYKIWVMTVHMA